MAKSKYKIGDKLQFNFAGMPCVGIVERIDDVMWGTVERQWIRCKGADGTIYPLEESEDSIIKIK